MPAKKEHLDPPDFPHSRLLRWYRQHRRKLPWRPRKKTNTDPGVVVNPYHVLLSEAMAQQTQIATVVPYFERFVAAFPTVHDLAAADEQQVLKLWQGLGYYRRARHLHAAAQTIVEQHDGKVPCTVDDLLNLPGVGRYTAGAIASIAHNQPAPILDGNVARVLARFDRIETPVNDPLTLKQLWARSEQLVQSAPKASRGDFNQALMELGALICTPPPGSPKCLYCPLGNDCRAFADGRVEQLPVKTPKKKPTAVTHLVVAIEKNGKLLFEQRPPKGLWSNMWQLPTWELPPEARDSDSPPAGRGRGRVPKPKTYRAHSDKPEASSTLPQPLPAGGALKAHLRERFGLNVAAPGFVDVFKHQTTHRTITFRVYRTSAKAGRLKPRTGQWRRPDELHDLPLAKPQLTALTLLK